MDTGKERILLNRSIEKENVKDLTFSKVIKFE